MCRSGACAVATRFMAAFASRPDRGDASRRAELDRRMSTLETEIDSVARGSFPRLETLSALPREESDFLPGDPSRRAAAADSFWCQLGLRPPCPKGDAPARGASEKSRRNGSRASPGKSPSAKTSERLPYALSRASASRAPDPPAPPPEPEPGTVPSTARSASRPTADRSSAWFGSRPVASSALCAVTATRGDGSRASSARRSSRCRYRPPPTRAASALAYVLTSVKETLVCSSS
mmetsp:Transcript_5051/g.21481  ORF Transcript_5051/g.21481 Transcript_5051/m.21481 type:complete len:235 (+) Transcript_5051:2363-3067(+)